MTVDELWKNLKPFMEKVLEEISILKSDVSILKEKVSTLEEDVSILKSDVSTLKSDVSILKEKVSALEEDVSILKSDVSILKSDVSTLKTDMHAVKDVNMTKLITIQLETRRDIEKLSKKLDESIEKNELDHKKFEYQIANLEWKTKIVN